MLKGETGALEFFSGVCGRFVARHCDIVRQKTMNDKNVLFSRKLFLVIENLSSNISLIKVVTLKLINKLSRTNRLKDLHLLNLFQIKGFFKKRENLSKN